MAHDWILLRKVSSFLSSTQGRDKTCRLIQYIGMLAASVERSRRKNGQPSPCDHVQKMEKLANTMSMTRKVLRIGKPVGNLMQVILAIRKILNDGSRKPHETKPLLGFKAAKDSLLILYYLCDHLVWLSRIGILNKEGLKKKMEHYGYISWLFALFCTIAYELLFLQISKELEGQMNDVDQTYVSKAKLEQKACFTELARVVLDLPVATWYINNNAVPETLAGALGLVTSCIGCYQHWVK